MALIAKNAGVSVGSIYQYFATKDDIFDAVGASIFADLQRSASAVLEHPEPGADQMQAMFVDVVGRLRRDLPVFRFMELRASARGVERKQEFELWAVESFASAAVRAGRAADVAHGKAVARTAVRAMVGLFRASSLYDVDGVDEERLVQSLMTITDALAPVLD